ncbi:SUKH-4 family immunity protein [Streptomyces sp. ISL-98]|uniref:SUKH-4 family immunity protein n=1 Tax=Streptomyces sp. ISL-98 TaxID=2819192 RepID=UPI0027E437E4|nr:SUKH-4 family immunity protein [Streptomyces sp. ISL-98]
MHKTELLAKAEEPTAEWLESIFGVGSLWRPTETEIPVRLEDKEARKFLTTVGFPAVRIDFIDFTSAGLPKDGLWEEDPDELFGRRYPDDDTPPTSYCYGFGTYGGGFHVLLNGPTGDVDVYDPNGWDHAAGYAGWAVSSLPKLAGALGLLKAYEDRLAGPEPAVAAQELRLLVEQLEAGGESAFWEHVLEQLEDEYGPWED